MPVAVAAFGVVVEADFGDTDVVNGPAGPIGGVVGDILKTKQNLPAGIGGQVNLFFDPGRAILARNAGVTRPVGVAGRVGGDAARGWQDGPRVAAVG